MSFPRESHWPKEREAHRLTRLALGDLALAHADAVRGNVITEALRGAKEQTIWPLNEKAQRLNRHIGDMLGRIQLAAQYREAQIGADGTSWVLGRQPARFSRNQERQPHHCRLDLDWQSERYQVVSEERPETRTLHRYAELALPISEDGDGKRLGLAHHRTEYKQQHDRTIITEDVWLATYPGLEYASLVPLPASRPGGNVHSDLIMSITVDYEQRGRGKPIPWRRTLLLPGPIVSSASVDQQQVWTSEDMRAAREQLDNALDRLPPSV